MSLSPSRLALAHQRFLAQHPEVVSLLHSITPRHASAVGLSVEAFQREELDRAIAREAKAKGVDSFALLVGYLADE